MGERRAGRRPAKRVKRTPLARKNSIETKTGSGQLGANGAEPLAWRRGLAVALSCVLVAGLVPVASFAQGAREAGDAASAQGVSEDAGLLAADGGQGTDAVAAGGETLAVGNGVVAGSIASERTDAAAGGTAGSAGQADSTYAAGAAGRAAGIAGEAGSDGAASDVAASGNSAQVASGASDDASSSGADNAGDTGNATVQARAANAAENDASEGDSPDEKPEYDGTEASYVYDEYYGSYFLVTTKGVTGEKVEGDNGYVAGTVTPAQAWLTLDEDAGELTVDHVDGGVSAFAVPATVDNRPIVKVGGCGQENLTSVTFPDDSHVREFGWSAFAGSGIASIALPNSLEDLGQGAFYNCKKLQTVVWAKNNDMLKSIPEQAFYGCSMLDDDVVATIPASVETIDYQAFANCEPDNFVEGETPEPFTDIVIPAR